MVVLLFRKVCVCAEAGLHGERFYHNQEELTSAGQKFQFTPIIVDEVLATDKRA
jgi:hypothetical protein